MDHNLPSLPGKSAAYGYSCSNCAQSKRKCIVPAVGGPCQRFVPDPDWREPSHGADLTRCHKTNKECLPAKTVRRSGVRKPAAMSQVNQLGKRTEAGRQNSAIAHIVNSTDAPLALVNNQDGNLSHVRGDESTSSSINGGQTNAGTPNTSYSKSSSGTPDLDLNPDECEECLTHFREFKLKYFPFVHIPSEMTAAELREVRPFLWLCIMSISTKSTARQKALAHEIRKTVAQVMLLESEKSIDLLVGLLIFLGW